ncbi:hypothetical protein F5Y04DRAFT_290845 [Hypomontagnella monticulosa]|nr:hypothetical protein F5Y04DRAFT_290845 [Hypomontagnella monticulosa]
MADGVGMAMAVVGFTANILSAAEWIKDKVSKFEDAPEVYLKMQGIAKIYHENIFKLMMNGVNMRTRGDFQPLLEYSARELSEALGSAKDCLEKHVPRNNKHRLTWALKGEVEARKRLDAVEKAVNNLRFSLELVKVHDAEEENPRELPTESLDIHESDRLGTLLRLGRIWLGKGDSHIRNDKRVFLLTEDIENGDTLKNAARHLARVADWGIDAEHSVGLFRYLGYRGRSGRGHKRKPGKLIFMVPDYIRDPQTLRNCISRTEVVDISLNDRFRLAYQLSRAVLHIHAAGLAHRDLRSDTILVLKKAPGEAVGQSMGNMVQRGREIERTEPPKRKRRPSLRRKASSMIREWFGQSAGEVKSDMGEQSRENELRNQSDFVGTIPDGFGSLFVTHWHRVIKQGMPQDRLRTRNDDLSTNIYRHPLLRKDNPEQKYSIGFDIYSLGVCLLEIGLWSILVEPSGIVAKRSMVRYLLMKKTGSRHTGYHHQRFSEWGGRDLAGLQECLVGVAQKQLKSMMGEAYAKLVTDCLKWLDVNPAARNGGSFGHVAKEYIDFREMITDFFSQVKLGEGSL